MRVELLTLDDVDIDGQRVLLRMDHEILSTSSVQLGQPPEADEWRCRLAFATLDELRRRGAQVALLGECGDARASMRPVAERLSRLTGVSVELVSGVVGPKVRDSIERLAPGEMVMLENALSQPGERLGDPALALALAEHVDLCVNDAFAIAHERRASTWGLAQHVPAIAGRLMAREVHALTTLIDQPARPLVAIIGGAGIRSHMGLLRRLLETADFVGLGGELSFSLLGGSGNPYGHPSASPYDLELARAELIAPRAGRLVVPSDLVVAAPGETSCGQPADLASRWLGIDIGPATAEQYAQEILGAATVLWSGVMGHYGPPPLQSGTRTVASAVATTAATTVVAGDATARALRAFGVADHVGHISAGGAAMAALLEGRELPGVAVLLRGDQAQTLRRGGMPDADAPRTGSRSRI